MFPARYFANRFFNPRYWPAVGSDISPPTDVEIADRLTIVQSIAGNARIQQDLAARLKVTTDLSDEVQV